MKGTDQFKKVIEDYLKTLAGKDPLFKERYEATTRTTDDVVTYILNTVHASGLTAYTSEEIFSLAVHVIDEPELEIGKPIDAVVVREGEISDEEKAELHEQARQKYLAEQMRLMQEQNQRPKKPQTPKVQQAELSLFD